jgi:hypothetical protein
MPAGGFRSSRRSLYAAAAVLLAAVFAHGTWAQEDALPQTIERVEIVVRQRSAPVCRDADKEYFRARLTDFVNTYPGVEEFSTFVRPSGDTQVGSADWCVGRPSPSSCCLRRYDVQ